MLLRTLDIHYFYRLAQGWYRFRPIGYRQLLAKVWHYQALSRQRFQLRELSDEQLKDIGITRAEALKEANKRFWED